MSVPRRLPGAAEAKRAAPELPFLWHPFLYHYGTNAQVPGRGPYDVTVRFAPPGFMRHDPVNGHRYAESADVHFGGVRLANGRKLSPTAKPWGEDAPTVLART